MKGAKITEKYLILVSLFYDLKKRIDSDVKKVSFTMTKAIMYSDTPRAFPSYSRYSVNYAVQRL